MNKQNQTNEEMIVQPQQTWTEKNAHLIVVGFVFFMVAAVVMLAKYLPK